ncbi:HmuY family protein [Flavobacterium pectinovorum]|uniref:HmuY family protein n=1 Tax=Flavobacterium pectinovorum TaxID=29533 RepID=UPI001FAB49B2|nr:HmuY family protein [Flavobacterium pectinovorum]MCI9843382.1 HmuY family protein [Flavobacterium pectinovorum]
MKTILSKYNLLLVLLVSLVITSCSNNEDGDTSAGLEDGKSTVIRDLAGDTNGSMGEGVDGKTKKGFDTFLFRFSDKKQIWIRNAADSTQYLKTKDWDIAFTGPYNSEVYVNKGSYQYNPGYGGSATSAVVKIDNPYAEVTEAPSDQEFSASEINKIGWAFSDAANGWFFYSLDTHLMIPIKNRTYVIHLPDGKYAKLELINAYQGNPPTVTNLNWPAPYFTFRYFVQNDGSKNLKTK